MKRAGVLALQGDFERHEQAIRDAGGTAVRVRTAAELATVDGLIIPGGESTAMLKLIEYQRLWEPLAAFGAAKPVFGTCAGAILAAREVLNPPQPSFGFVDLTVERNAYGRQLDSRIVHFPVAGLDGGGDLEAVFIRAPIIRRWGAAARVLASYLDSPVLVDCGRHLVATFHPELSPDPRIHRLFLSKLGS
jgi:5'-phosphate synthase pdxT subunit